MIEMSKYSSLHLVSKRKIQLGSFYTPEVLVNKVRELINPYKLKNKNKTIIFDNASGCGAFIDVVDGLDYRFADFDKDACNFLKKNLGFSKDKVFHGNSLFDVRRNKYNIPPNAYLIQVGNPPYNDTTSEFKNGQKGENDCDPDLFDRDLGVSFLKSYNKLKSDVVCVLHPLSYLIKKTNFNRLKDFKNNYTLKKGVIFSSSLFKETGSIKFPIIIALYERTKEGMDYDYIKTFDFSVLNSDIKFKIDNFETSDGYINKYPPRKNESKHSSIGLYYYTFRDFNSLKKNTSFLDKSIPNGIIVEIDNFYKYAFLYSLKTLFSPDNIWLYGNLSPLVRKNILENNKKIFVIYALKNNPIIKNLDKNLLKKIAEYYKINLKDSEDINKIESKINKIFDKILFFKKSR